MSAIEQYQQPQIIEAEIVPVAALTSVEQCRLARQQREVQSLRVAEQTTATAMFCLKMGWVFILALGFLGAVGGFVQSMQPAPIVHHGCTALGVNVSCQ